MSKISKDAENIIAKLNSHDERFNNIDERFTEIDGKFNSIDARFSVIDNKFDAIDVRFEKIETKLKKHDELLNSIIGTLYKHEVILKDLQEGMKLVKKLYHSTDALVKEITESRHDRIITGGQIIDHEKRITFLESARAI